MSSTAIVLRMLNHANGSLGGSEGCVLHAYDKYRTGERENGPHAKLSSTEFGFNCCRWLSSPACESPLPGTEDVVYSRGLYLEMPGGGLGVYTQLL